MTKILIVAAIALAIPSVAASADDGLVTKPSRHSVEETIDHCEAAIKAQAAGGWVVFGRIDHAAAAKKAGRDMWPRTIIIFGNPKAGTLAMTKSATLAIDLPMKASSGRTTRTGSGSHIILATTTRNMYCRDTVFLPPTTHRKLLKTS